MSRIAAMHVHYIYICTLKSLHVYHICIIFLKTLNEIFTTKLSAWTFWIQKVLFFKWLIYVHVCVLQLYIQVHVLIL